MTKRSTRTKKGRRISLPMISVVIVTHNRKQHLMKALTSVFNCNYSKDRLEVIVVDDASEDGTFQTVSERYGNLVRIVRNEDEMLLAESRNRGFKLANSTYILQMDDDCLLAESTIRDLVEVMLSNARIGVVGPAVYHSSGKLAYTGARIFPFFMPIRSKAKAKIIEADFVPGTVGLFRREAIVKAGLWDGRNFALQAEDADVCLRMRKFGYSAVCATSASAFHLKRPSLVDVSSLLRAYEAGRSRVLLYKNHLGRIAFVFYIVTVNMLILLFYLLFIVIKNKDKFNHMALYIRGVAHGLAAALS